MICVVVKQRSCWLVWRAGDIYRPGQTRPAPPVSLLSYQQRAVRLRRYKKQTGWESWHCWSSLHSVNMRQFVSVQYFHCPVSSLSPLTGCRPLLGCRQSGCPRCPGVGKALHQHWLSLRTPHTCCRRSGRHTQRLQISGSGGILRGPQPGRVCGLLESVHSIFISRLKVC